MRITAVAYGLNASKEGSNVNVAAEMISMEGNVRDLFLLIHIPAEAGGVFLPDHGGSLAGTRCDRGG